MKFVIFILSTFVGIYSATANTSGNISLILWGQSGAGISSTVRSILGQNASITSEQTTAEVSNASITEYLVSLQTSTNPTHIKIVDVDGLNSDTVQDAMTMTTLLHLVQNTTDQLLVALVSPFDDKEFYDENSQFTKMLRKVSQFQELLQQRINQSTSFPTFLILSKLMKEGKLISEKPESKSMLFKTAIIDLVPNMRGLTRNIVFGENKPEFSSLRRNKDGNVVLPNGELYPKNLLDKIQASVKQVAGMKEAMTKFEEVRSSGLRAENSVITQTAVPNELLLVQVEGIDGGVQDSEVAKYLQKYYAELNATGRGSTQGLVQLQLFLQEKSIKSKNQVENLGKEDLAQLYVDYGNDEDNSFKLFRDAFKLQAPLPRKLNGRNVTVIVMGKGESGISSTVQKILGPSADITLAGRRSPSIGEAYVTEYDISFPDIQSSLRIVDVEGIIEGKAVGHEDKVFSSFISYLINGMGGSTPNFWQIISNFDDNKFMGAHSSWTRMILSIHKLQNLIKWDDIKDSSSFRNVLLFTKVMTESGKNQRNPETKSALYSSAINHFSGLKLSSVPLVGDNMGGQGLQVNGYITLPNGDIYPGNMLDNWFKLAGDNSVEQSVIGRFRDVRSSMASYKVVKSYY